jgi:hypothetical protein
MIVFKTGVVSGKSISEGSSRPLKTQIEKLLNLRRQIYCCNSILFRRKRKPYGLLVSALPSTLLTSEHLPKGGKSHFGSRLSNTQIQEDVSSNSLAAACLGSHLYVSDYQDSKGASQSMLEYEDSGNSYIVYFNMK